MIALLMFGTEWYHCVWITLCCIVATIFVARFMAYKMMCYPDRTDKTVACVFGAMFGFGLGPIMLAFIFFCYCMYGLSFLIFSDHEKLDIGAAIKRAFFIRGRA